MRVAIVAESFLPQVNGVTNSVLRILEHLRRRGEDAVVICPDDPLGVPDSYEGYPVTALPSLPLPWYHAIKIVTSGRSEIRDLLVELNPDVIHLAAPFILGYRAALAAAELAIPVVAIYQTEIPRFAQRYGFPPAEGLLWKRVEAIHNLAFATFAPSSYSRDELLDHGISRVGIWGRGVDSTRFSPTKRNLDLRREWAPDGEVIIGYMGRIGKEKQLEDLAVIADLPGVCLVVIGDGPARKSVEQKLPSARFLGMLGGEELAEAVASFDIFVHPGEYETFGQAIQEAEASGLPVIAPRVGGPIDLVTDQVNGYLYTPGDLDQLRAYTLELVNDKGKREEFGRQGRLRAEANTWESICEQMLEHYREAVAVSNRDMDAGTDSATSLGG